MTSKSKTKGNALEREIAKLLNKELNSTEFARTPSSGAMMGKSNWNKNKGLAIDVKHTLGSDLITPSSFCLSIECKNYKDKPNHAAVLAGNDTTLNNWIIETEFDANNLKLWPMLVFKTNRKGTFVVLRRECIIHLEVPMMLYNEHCIVALDHFITVLPDVVAFTTVNQPCSRSREDVIEYTNRPSKLSDRSGSLQ